MKNTHRLFLLGFTILFSSCTKESDIKISGELKTWHRVTFDILGPTLSEHSLPNPFLDYRLEGIFTNGTSTYRIPGFFAADGNAAESSAVEGNIWRIHFCPDKAGTWNYEISFRRGKDIALSDDLKEGDQLGQDGRKGSFVVEESDKTGFDFRGKGRLERTGGHYLRHAGSGEYFLKGGADSPENFLGYCDFDGTWYGGNKRQRSGEDTPNAGLHSYAAHIKDWKNGDPSWKNGKGKGIIGALNYLSSKGMNSVYFLTLNILGDGEDVWPYSDRNERYRFDCSKLDQWEIVFAHMDRLGIMLHIVLQETENELLLDAGYLDTQRKLYLRELVARFSHHNAITWNLGEEHGPIEWSPYGQTYADTKKMADYLRSIDPYKSQIVVHTHSNQDQRNMDMEHYLGHESIDGPSIQCGSVFNVHASTLKMLKDSDQAGHPWVVCQDEIGQHWKGAMPDASDPAHDTIRQQVLWGNLMAGGAGVEWYFGYKYPHGDLNCEDWRSRDLLWDQTRVALDFFNKYLPFQEMTNMDHLVSGAYCFAKSNELYAVYYPTNDYSSIDLRNSDGFYRVKWYMPVEGGELLEGSVHKVRGGDKVNPGAPPEDKKSIDWICLLERE